MARKSRKQIVTKGSVNTTNNVISSEKLATVIYARLSEENNGYGTDDSIETQIKLLKEYVKQHENLSLTEVYVDNGFSGTNFSRPEFEKMMEMVKRGKVKCIVVKDLSRLGRDYLETGYYLENVFPLFGVRFIAINDNFDSFNLQDRDSMMIAIKNMVNDIYSKDLSRKRMATLEIKKDKGIMDTAFAPYGYYYLEGTDQLEPIPELVPYVRMIFSWYQIGVPITDIAKRLKLMGVPTALEILHRRGIQMNKPVTPWGSIHVRNIIINPVYAGAVVFNKSSRCLYKKIKKRVNPRKEWLCYYDRHPFIICPEEYKIIDENLQARQEAFKEKNEKIDVPPLEKDCFHGILRCGECKKNLPWDTRSYTKDGEVEIIKYGHFCSEKDTGISFTISLQQDLLKMIVMDQIKILVQTMVDNKELLRCAKKNKKKDPLAALKNSVLQLQNKKNIYEENKNELYMDYSSGLLDLEEYQVMKEKNIFKIQEIDREIKRMKKKLEDTKFAVERYIARAEELEKLIVDFEFSEELVKELIDKIYVYRGNRIEIIFKCDDIIHNKLVDELFAKGEEA